MIGTQLVFMVTGTLLIFIGIAFIGYARNLVKSVMAFQVVLFGANLSIFSSSLGGGSPLMSGAFVLLSILVGAAVEATGLALIVVIHRKFGTLDPEELRRMRH